MDEALEKAGEVLRAGANILDGSQLSAINDRVGYIADNLDDVKSASSERDSAILDAAGSISKNLDNLKEHQLAQSDRNEATWRELENKIDMVVSRINDAEQKLEKLVNDRADDIYDGLQLIRVRVTKSILGRLFKSATAQPAEDQRRRRVIGSANSEEVQEAQVEVDATLVASGTCGAPTASGGACGIYLSNDGLCRYGIHNQATGRTAAE